MYGETPPDGVTVVEAVVCEDVGPDLYSEVGEAEAVMASRMISTFTSTVLVAATLSVTVQRNTAV